MPEVAWLSVAPVKGLALVERQEVVLGADGVAENRRFYLVDEDGRFYAGIRNGRLVQVEPRYEVDPERLELRFPDGEVVAGDVALGEPVLTNFYGRDVPGRVVEGPWAAALSRFAGRQLALVRAERPGGGVDRARGPVSLVSHASLEALGRHAGGGGAVDGRRFRMLIGVTGCAAHEEDGWCGRRIAIGEAVVRVLEPVARCAVTTHNPATGEPDLDTLRTIAAYRGRRGGKHLDFGVYGDVGEAGRVRLGDPVELLVDNRE